MIKIHIQRVTGRYCLVREFPRGSFAALHIDAPADWVTPLCSSAREASLHATWEYMTAESARTQAEHYASGRPGHVLA